MASINEVQGMLMAAAEKLGSGAGYADGASQMANEAMELAQAAFEGSGRGEIIDATGRLSALQVAISDNLLEFMSLQTTLQQIASSM